MLHEENSGKLFFDIDPGKASDPLFDFTGFSLGPSKEYSILKAAPVIHEVHDITWTWHTNLEIQEFANLVKDCTYAFHRTSEKLKFADEAKTATFEDVLDENFDTSGIVEMHIADSRASISWIHGYQNECAQHTVAFVTNRSLMEELRQFLFWSISREDARIINAYWHMIFTTTQGHNIREFGTEATGVLRAIKMIPYYTNYGNRGESAHRWKSPVTSLGELARALLEDDKRIKSEDRLWIGQPEQNNRFSIGELAQETHEEWSTVSEAFGRFDFFQFKWALNPNRDGSTIIVRDSGLGFDWPTYLFDVFKVTTSQQRHDAAFEEESEKNVWNRMIAWYNNGGLLS